MASWAALLGSSAVTLQEKEGKIKGISHVSGVHPENHSVLLYKQALKQIVDFGNRVSG